MSRPPFSLEADRAAYELAERRRQTQIRRRIVALHDEPCTSCGAPAGLLRVAEALEDATARRGLAPASCMDCARREIRRADAERLPAAGNPEGTGQ